MKIFKANIALIFLLITCLYSSGCKKEDDPTPTELAFAKLKAKTWAVNTVTVDNTDHSDLFPGLSLTFSDKTFSASNGNLVWPATGTWEFNDAEGTSILRDDGLVITIVELTESSLVLALDWDTIVFEPGRSRSVAGRHVFRFK